MLLFTFFQYLQVKFYCQKQCLCKKSRILETPTLSTDADSRTDTNLKRLRDYFFYFIFEREVALFFPGKTPGKQRENPGNTPGIPLENPGKTPGKPGKTPGKPGENS